jgi:hypothetical protein
MLFLLLLPPSGAVCPSAERPGFIPSAHCLFIIIYRDFRSFVYLRGHGFGTFGPILGVWL